MLILVVYFNIHLSICYELSQPHRRNWRYPAILTCNPVSVCCCFSGPSWCTGTQWWQEKEVFKAMVRAAG